MAKNKNLNPAEAYRKAQKRAAIKKNKAARVVTRTAKKDPRPLEAAIAALETKEGKTEVENQELGKLKKELKEVLKAGEERPDLARETAKRTLPTASGSRPRGPARDDDDEDEDGLPQRKGDSTVGRTRQLYDSQGQLHDPTISAFYDPKFNPWGVPPPGMPMRFKPGMEPPPADAESSSEEEDDDIEMPEGPPPLPPPEPEEAESDDDDIPLPEGPPPPKPPPARAPRCHFVPHITNSNASRFPHHRRSKAICKECRFRPRPQGCLGWGCASSSPSTTFFPYKHFAPTSSANGNTNPNDLLRSTASHLPSPTSHCSNLSCYHCCSTASRSPKRATSFLPAAIRKKRKLEGKSAMVAGLGGGGRVDAAPSGGQRNEEDGESGRKGLLGVLREGGLVTSGDPVQTQGGGAKGKEAEDDYEKFLKGMEA